MYAEQAQMAAPTKLSRLYIFFVVGNFLYKFSKKAIKRIITPMDATISDSFMLRFF